MIYTKTQQTHGLRILFAALFLSLFASCATAAERKGLVLQVSEDNPKLWNMVLNIAKAAPKNTGYPLDVEVVAFGPGLKMLTMNSSVGPRLKKLGAQGVEFRACGMTMKKMKLKDSDLYPDNHVKKVGGGAVEIMRLQGAGWYYIRP